MSVRRRWVGSLAIAVGCSALASCGSGAVVLDPAGSEARRAQAGWITVGVVAIVVILVVAVAVAAALIVRSRREDEDRRPGWLRGERLVVAGGFVLPAIVAIVVAIVGATSTTAIGSPEDAAVHIRIEAHQWWWNVEYLDTGITSANEIVIPTGATVALEITSDNVVHSLWFPQLAGRADVIPGRVTSMTIEADTPGVYDGRCAEYCGLQHAHMGLEAIAMTPTDYRAWIATERGAESANGSGPLPAGLGVFLSSGCDRCHTISGTVADGVVGPDLTHLGSRRTIGAGALPNTDADLARWIADPWSVKPGANMPGFAQQLTPYQLGALVQYLEGLR
jgi:cytochrome c oxidase subunit II